jgi:hypothetical protein
MSKLVKQNYSLDAIIKGNGINNVNGDVSSVVSYVVCAMSIEGCSKSEIESYVKTCSSGNYIFAITFSNDILAKLNSKVKPSAKLNLSVKSGFQKIVEQTCEMMRKNGASKDKIDSYVVKTSSINDKLHLISVSKQASN